MCVLPTYKYVCHVHTWCPWRSEENVGSPGTTVTDSYEPPCRHWNWSQVLSKSKKCSGLRSHLSTPLWHYFIMHEVFKRWGLSGSLSPCLASCGKPLKVTPTSVMILGCISFVLSGVTLCISLCHTLHLPWICPAMNCTRLNDELK